MGLLTLVRSLFIGQADMLGNATAGRAVTATLRVSARSTGGNGLSWRRAFTTIQDALDAASTDPNDMTLILVASGNYDINTAGDPTWAANVEIRGTHRCFAMIANNHAGATSVLNLTGLSAVVSVMIQLGTGNNGLRMTQTGWRVKHVHFNGANLTGAATGLSINGLAEHGLVEECEFDGQVANMTGLLLDEAAHNEFGHLHIHDCLIGIQIVNAASDGNYFHQVDIGDCALGIDIDAGNVQHFQHIIFHGNTRNVDDEVSDHIWGDINGQFPIVILPDNLTGIAVPTNAGANVWGVDTEILAAAARDNPFRIIGVHTEPSAAGWFEVRFSNDNGATFYDILLFDATKREGIAAPHGTEYIFNRRTRVSASSRSDTGGDIAQVWVELQEI